MIFFAQWHYLTLYKVEKKNIQPSGNGFNNAHLSLGHKNDVKYKVSKSRLGDWRTNLKAFF